MPDANADGNTRVFFVPTIANIAAPTTAELNAGTRLDTLMTPDGLIGLEADTGDVDNSKLSSTFNTVTPGRVSFSGTMVRLIRQTGTDTVYNLLVYGFSGFLVTRRGGVAASTAWAASQQVAVYPITCGEVRNVSPEGNSVEKYEVPMKVTSQPNLRALTA